MASAPASRWEPCTLPFRSHYLSLLLALITFLSCSLSCSLSRFLLLSANQTFAFLSCGHLSIRTYTRVVDGGGYDPKRRGAPAQSYAAPVQSSDPLSAPVAAPMPSVPASKWEPCTFSTPHHSLTFSSALHLVFCVSWLACLLAHTAVHPSCAQLRALSHAVCM